MRNNVLVKFRNNYLKFVMKNDMKYCRKTTACFSLLDEEVEKVRGMENNSREIFTDINRILIVRKYDGEYCLDLSDNYGDQYTGVALGSRISVTIPENKLFDSAILVKADEYQQAHFAISPLAQATIRKMRPEERRALMKILMTHFMSPNGEDVSVFLDCGKDFFFKSHCHGGLFANYDGGLIYEPTVIIGKDRKSHTAITYGKHT